MADIAATAVVIIGFLCCHSSTVPLGRTAAIAKGRGNKQGGRRGGGGDAVDTHAVL